MSATVARPPEAGPPEAGPPDTSLATAVDRLKPRGDVRRTLLALLASALGAFPLAELFTDTGWLVDAWLTMVVVIAPAAVLRRTRPPSAGQIWIGVLLLIPWLTATFLRQHAVLGFLPFRGTWHDLSLAITSLHKTSTEGVAPVHTTVAVRLAVCALLGLVAALVDLLAVVGRHGALAGVPLLIIFTIAGAVPRHPVSWIWFVVAALGFLILLALDSSDDVQRWGHFVPRSRNSRRRAGGAVSAQRVAIIAIVLALAVPVFIPSDSKNLLVDLFHNGGGDGESSFGANQNGGLGTGGIDPFAALHGELNREHSVPLLNVKISSPDGSVVDGGRVQPFYLRTNVLSDFQGDGWRPGPAGPSEPITQTGFSSAPGSSFQPRVVHYSAEISVTGLRSNPPVFGSPTAISGVDSHTEWSPRDMLLVGSTTDSDQVITEEVAQPDPTVGDLRAAGGQDPEVADWLKLPAITPYVQDITSKVTANARTPYETARAISNFFANPDNGFTYSLQAPVGDSGDQLTDFLRNRIGYCQQYAATMAVMLRLSGVPSRVVLGYAHNVPDDQGEFTVTTFDAHAWVEAYFSGIGWVPFDPTPLSGVSGGSANDLKWAPHNTKGGGGGIDPPLPRPSRSVDVVGSGAPAPRKNTTQATDENVSLTLPLTVLGVVVFVGLVALLPALVRWRRRRGRLHRIRDGDTEALWAELADTTTDLGYVWSDARTPRQVARWLGGSADSATGSLQALTRAVEQARYAPRAEQGPTDLVTQLDAVRAGLGQRRSPRERMRARFWPASLNWSRVRWVGRWLPGSDSARHR